MRIVDISAWGSARWSGKLAKKDVLEYIDGHATKGLTARGAIDLINGSDGAGPTVELVFVRHSPGREEERHVIELGRASPCDAHETVAPNKHEQAGGDLVAALHTVRCTSVWCLRAHQMLLL